MEETEAKIIRFHKIALEVCIFCNHTFNAENMVQIKGLKCQEQEQCIGAQFSYIFNKILRNTWKIFLDSVVFFFVYFLEGYFMTHSL